jgi:hypothetical protein
MLAMRRNAKRGHRNISGGNSSRLSGIRGRDAGHGRDKLKNEK